MSHWKSKISIGSIIGKGSILYKSASQSLKIQSVSPEIIKTKIAETSIDYSTRDTYQRKVFFDGVNFFVFFLDYVPDGLNPYKLKYSASEDGKNWSSPTVLRESSEPFNFDVCYPNRGTKDYNGEDVDFAVYMLDKAGARSRWLPYVISDKTIIAKVGGSLGGLEDIRGGTCVSNLNGTRDYMITHESSPSRIITHRTISYLDDYDTTIPYSSTSGGCQLLPYKTSSPYLMLALAKGGDNKLYYNLVNEPTATFTDSFKEVATLGTGFNDFCACSEAQNIGDPEIVHLVYIKDTGELCYRKFENDAWSQEITLISEGATYPVIASGETGKLYVFYVKNGKIMLKRYDGAWQPEEEAFKGYTYNNPRYLSSNQNSQNGKICLVWMEKTVSPFELYFNYLEDT